MPKILQPQEVRLPRAHNLILEPARDPRDHILSATLPEVAELGLAINDAGQWIENITEFEDQKNDVFDQYACVTHSGWNMTQCLGHRKYGVKLNKSKRYTAVKSGTIPGRGNSVTNVVESIRKDGGVDEEVYPTTVPGMTQAEFYQKIPADVDAKENFKAAYDFRHAWVDGNSQDMLVAALKVSPVMVSVYGRYSFDSNGYVAQDRSGIVTHEVVIVGYEYGKFWYVLDSENPEGLVRFAWDYIFIGPKIGYLLKKQIMQIFRIKGKSAAYFFNPESKEVVPFADGVIGGGSLFKIFFGDYKNANIQVVNSEQELPGPIAKYSITTF